MVNAKLNTEFIIRYIQVFYCYPWYFSKFNGGFNILNVSQLISVKLKNIYVFQHEFTLKLVVKPGNQHVMCGNNESDR